MVLIATFIKLESRGLIFYVQDKIKRKEIVQLLNKEKFGTKNLPDAIKWHCASFWGHALPKKQITRVNKTKKLLSSAIAVPISLKREIKDYKKLGIKISKIIN